MKKGFLIYLALVILSTGLIPQADSNKKELSLRDAIYQALKNNLNLKMRSTKAKMA